MADNGLLKIGLFAGAAYLAYQQGWLSALGLTPSTVPASSAPAGPATSNPVTGANSLDSIYTRMIAAAKAPAEGLAVDDWDYFLNQQLPAGKVAPDPMVVFPAAISGFDRSQKVTAAQYWAVMAPALRTQLGLSGLGVYGGLGSLLRRYR